MSSGATSLAKRSETSAAAAAASSRTRSAPRTRTNQPPASAALGHWCRELVGGRSLVGKLTYMIKKSNQRNRREGAERAPPAAPGKQLADSSGGGGGSSANSGSRHLLSELSRRLVERCKRSKFVTRPQNNNNSSSSYNSDSNCPTVRKQRDSDLSTSDTRGSLSSYSPRPSSESEPMLKTKGSAVAATTPVAGLGSNTTSGGGGSSSMLSCRSGAAAAGGSGELAPPQSRAGSKASAGGPGGAVASGCCGGSAAATAASSGNLTHLSSNSTLSTTQTAATTPSACGCSCDESTTSGFISCPGLDIISSSSTSYTANNDHQDSASAHHQHQHHHQQLTSEEAAQAAAAVEVAEREASRADTQRGPRELPSQPLSLAASSTSAMMIETQKQPEASAKKGSSILSRARNSTINLASLATVTHRFNCSASVGNLWSSYGAGSQQPRRELAELSGDSHDVKPLDYVPHAAFDHFDQQRLSDALCNNNNNIGGGAGPEEQAANGGSKSCQKSLFSIGSAPVSRKSSSKEKKKRQKDAEKVEKLRLLVSYLKSGTSQPLLKPVTLEADEIELAQKYKLHLILCDDCLQQVELEQQLLQQHQRPRAGLTGSASTGSILSGGGGVGGSWSPSTIASAADSQQMSTIAGIVINVRRSSEQLPANNSSANNLATNNSSSPTLVVPRNLSAGHSPNSASSPSIDEHNSSIYSSSSNNSDHNLHHSDLNHPHHNYQHHNHNQDDSQSQASSQLQQQQLLCYKCKRPTGRNMSSIMSSADLAASDIDSNLSSSFKANQESGPADAQLTPPPTLNQGLHTPAYKQSTNASVLATWIDNEVNSLVNDLEAKSQLVKEAKSSSGKRKWLSGSSSSRRNSSGAHST